MNISRVTISFFLFSKLAFAGEADVLDVKIRSVDRNTFAIDVTVRHDDTGWDHYANAWEVLDEAGQVLGSRLLLHPHIDEQPFTRSNTVIIPEGVKKITVRAKDLVHGLGGEIV
ncbi:MAG: hypothetical protein V3U75_09055, partial [Methylococcaceae bacterium]